MACIFRLEKEEEEESLSHRHQTLESSVANFQAEVYMSSKIVPDI